MQRAFRVLSVSKKRILLGFRDREQAVKAAAHQVGVKKRNLPKRPWVGLSKRQISKASRS